MTIKIDVKRTGFPIKIGNLDLWFDSSIENLKNFFNIEQITQDRLKKARKKAEHVHFPDDINEENVLEIEENTINAAFDVHKEFIAIQYDILFGDGAFKKIYDEYPDIIALEGLLKPLGEAIAQKIEEQEQERKSEVEKIKNEYLKKKAQKR